MTGTLLAPKSVWDWLFSFLGIAGMLCLAYIIGARGQAFILAPVLMLWLGVVLVSRQGIPSTGIEIPILFGVATLVVNVILSADPRRSLNGLTMILLYLFWFYFMFDLARRKQIGMVIVGGLLVIGALVVAGGLTEVPKSLVLSLQWIRDGVYPSGSPMRVNAVLENANVLSGFLVLLPPFVLALLPLARNLTAKLLLWLWFLGILITQFFTWSRGGWLGAALALAAMLVFIAATRAENGERAAHRWWKYWRERPLLRTSSLVLAFPLVAGIGYLSWRQLQRPDGGVGFASRQLVWEVALAAFRSSPLNGTGLSTFSTEWIKQNPMHVPLIFGHAHSIPLGLLAEQGLLGALGIVLLIGAYGSTVWKNRKGVAPQHRLLLGAGIASLLGFTMHGLFDDFFVKPAVFLTVLIIAALVLALPQWNDSWERTAPNFWIAPLLALGLALFVGIGFWSNLALMAFNDGVRLARDGEWEEAAQSFGRAVEIDGRFAFYSLQHGYALGAIAADSHDDTRLNEAIGAYERGIELEPNYAVNHANLFALYWEAGRWDEALRELEAALDLARYPLRKTKTNQYGSLVFHRKGIPMEFLPQLSRLVSQDGPITEDWVELFAARAGRYRELNQAKPD